MKDFNLWQTNSCVTNPEIVIIPRSGSTSSCLVCPSAYLIYSGTIQAWIEAIQASIEVHPKTPSLSLSRRKIFILWWMSSCFTNPETVIILRSGSTSGSLVYPSAYSIYSGTIQAWSEAFRPQSYLFNHKKGRVFTLLLEDISLMCVKFLKDNLLARVVPYPRTSIPKNFDPHAHCLYYMDAIGHKTRNCWQLKHKVST